MDQALQMTCVSLGTRLNFPPKAKVQNRTTPNSSDFYSYDVPINFQSCAITWTQAAPASGAEQVRSSEGCGGGWANGVDLLDGKHPWFSKRPYFPKGYKRGWVICDFSGPPRNKDKTGGRSLFQRNLIVGTAQDPWALPLLGPFKWIALAHQWVPLVSRTQGGGWILGSYLHSPAKERGKPSTAC